MEPYDYCRKIRNTNKRQYAESFLRFLIGKSFIEPQRENFNLGAMAAQAVRMELRALIEKRGF